MAAVGKISKYSTGGKAEPLTEKLKNKESLRALRLCGKKKLEYSDRANLTGAGIHCSGYIQRIWSC